MQENKSCPERVQSVFPRVVFVKTKKRITKENRLELMDSIIYDDDTPEITGETVAFPLSITDYPSALRSMTASQAGWWAMQKCRQQNWKLDEDNIRSCLANLEMDM